MCQWIVISLLTMCSVIQLCRGDVGDTARAECRKYGEAMVECQRLLHGSKKRVPADVLEFPHMVMVGYQPKPDKEIDFNCGGSLISPLWVLSAAHCLGDSRTGPPVRVRLGTTTLEDEELEEDIVQERGLVKLVKHPDYKPPSKYNDIALLKMDKPISNLGEHIRVACLQTDYKEGVKMARASGFGKTSFDNAGGSLTMMHVDLDIIPQIQCNRSLRSMIRRGGVLTQGVLPSQLCAGDLVKGGRDTCQGDSGGPLQILPENPDCKKSFFLYVILGVTSFGRFCGFRNSPGVYTRVSHYVGWIEDTVWPKTERFKRHVKNTSDLEAKTENVAEPKDSEAEEEPLKKKNKSETDKTEALQEGQCIGINKTKVGAKKHATDDEEVDLKELGLGDISARKQVLQMKGPLKMLFDKIINKGTSKFRKYFGFICRLLFGKNF